MDEIKKLLSALTLQQKIALGLAIVLVASALPAFIHWQHERDFRPLFTGMSAEDAGAVRGLRRVRVGCGQLVDAPGPRRQRRSGDNGRNVPITAVGHTALPTASG